MTATAQAPEVPKAPPPEVHKDAPRGSLASWWSDTLVFAGRNIEHIRQIPEKLLDVTLQPLMFVLLFAYVFGGAIAVSGGNYREFIIGGILIPSLAFGLTGPATAISSDLTEGVIDRFRSLPATTLTSTCSRRSTRLDSSVPTKPSSWALAKARSSSSRRKTCGVCAITSRSLGMVAVILLRLTCFTVSTGTIPTIAAPHWAASWNVVSIVAGSIKGRTAS